MLKDIIEVKPLENYQLYLKFEDNSERKAKRPGSAKKSKKAGFEVDEEKIIQPEEIPAQDKFNGYRDYEIQELKIERHNIRFRTC